MPIIDLTIAEGTLSAEARERLLGNVSRIAIEYEGLAGSEFAERFTWVYTQELPNERVRQVPGPPPKPLYRFAFTTLEGLLDDEAKKRLGQDVARAVYEVEGTAWDEEEAYNRVWVFFDDYRQGDWIVGGRVNAIHALRERVEAERASAA